MGAFMRDWSALYGNPATATVVVPHNADRVALRAGPGKAPPAGPASPDALLVHTSARTALNFGFTGGAT